MSMGTSASETKDFCDKASATSASCRESLGNQTGGPVSGYDDTMIFVNPNRKFTLGDGSKFVCSLETGAEGDGLNALRT